MIVRLFEVLRCLLAALGFYMVYAAGLHSAEALRWFMLLVVTPVVGLTGLQSLFFSKQSEKALSREQGSSYQTQSAFNNLAMAITITTLLTLLFNALADAPICFSKG